MARNTLANRYLEKLSLDATAALDAMIEEFDKIEAEQGGAQRIEDDRETLLLILRTATQLRDWRLARREQRGDQLALKWAPRP